jgi:hypothetical protein
MRLNVAVKITRHTNMAANNPSSHIHGLRRQEKGSVEMPSDGAGFMQYTGCV